MTNSNKKSTLSAVEVATPNKPAYIVECNKCHTDYQRCQHTQCPHCGSTSFSDTDDYLAMFSGGGYLV